MLQFPKNLWIIFVGGDSEKALLKKAMKQLSLSARAYNKILKVSQTIADQTFNKY